MSSPRAPAPLVDFGAPPAPSAICMDCETTTMLVAGKLPIGWEEVERRWGKSARCASCRRSREAAKLVPGGAEATPKRIAKSPTARLLAGCVPVDDALPTGRLYAGARIYHWLVGGNAVLRIHGGAGPRPAGRDEPIHFLATPADIDELIIHLARIRNSLTGTDQ